MVTRFATMVALSLLLASRSPKLSRRPHQTSRRAQRCRVCRAGQEWTTKPEFMSPLVDHLPKKAGVPTPEGHPGLSHRRAEQADLHRRPAAILPCTRKGAARPRENDGRRQERGGPRHSDGLHQLRSQPENSRDAIDRTEEAGGPARSERCRRSKESSRQPSRTITSPPACTAPRPRRPRA